jgi:hypothetical protein
MPHILAMDTELVVLAILQSWQLLAAKAASPAKCASSASSGQMPLRENYFPDEGRVYL